MNRVIKFRAWNGDKMYAPDEVIIYLGNAWLENFSLDAKVLHVKDTHR